MSGSARGIYFVHGMLDDMRIYDRTLSETEIRDLIALANAGDLTPPLLANGQPTGTLPAGTTETTISLDTDERAICKCDTVIDTPYALMADTFATTDATSHATLVGGLEDGRGHTFYVRYADIVGNATTIDFQISFTVLNDTPVGFHPTDLPDLLFYVELTFFEDPDNRARSVATCHTQACYDANKAADNIDIEKHYCDTVLDGNEAIRARGIAPDGCIRRWEDQSGYLSNRNAMFPDELFTGRDFGQDDLEKPIYVTNCINGHPFACGAPASDPEFPQNTSFEVENADGFSNVAEPPTGSDPTEGLEGPFSVFHLVKPVAQTEDWWSFVCANQRGLRHNVADNSLYYQCNGQADPGCVG